MLPVNHPILKRKESLRWVNNFNHHLISVLCFIFAINLYIAVPVNSWFLSAKPADQSKQQLNSQLASHMLETFYKWLGISFTMIAQYMIFVTLIYLIFYTWKNKKIWAAKIQQKYPKNKHIFREIRYSIYTLCILGVIIVFVVWANKHHLTRAYYPINKYGYTYYFLSMVIMLVVHDTYFYWGHRLLHWKPLFKHVHKTHHLSLNPSPFAAYAFHPFEAIFEMGIMPLIVFTIPHHISTITIFALYSLAINIAAHVGYEFLPKSFTRHKLFKWHNTPTHHNLHHQYFKYNYGLYFNFWDRIMKTNHPRYETYFEELAERRGQAQTDTEHIDESILDSLKAPETAGID